MEPTVRVDERVELDGLLQARSTAAPAGYHRPAEMFARAVLPRPTPDFAPPVTVPFEARAQLLLRLGPPPALDGLDAVPRMIAEPIGAPADVARWLESLRSLARSTETAAALREERRELAPAVEDFRRRISTEPFVAAIEAYCGMPLQGAHRIALSPFHSAAGVANVVTEGADGRVEIETLLGPLRRGPDADYWGPRVPGTLWHEEAHGILDPLADAWAGRIDRAAPADPAAVCYGGWRQCVREHVVRAVMIRLMARRYGRAAADEQLAFENPRRFLWLEPMIESLRLYEAGRDKWPTLADYYPRLLDAVKPDASDDAAPFRADREPPQVRARISLLASAVLPRMREPTAVRHLAAARVLAEAPLPESLDAAAPGGTSPGPRAEEPRDPAAAALSDRGMAAFQAGDAEAALRLFELAAEREPGNPDTAMSRAALLERLGRSSDALDAYRDAAASARRRPAPGRVLADALLARARLLGEAGRREDARRSVAEALSSAPDDWEEKAAAEQLRASLER